MAIAHEQLSGICKSVDELEQFYTRFLDPGHRVIVGNDLLFRETFSGFSETHDEGKTNFKRRMQAIQTMLSELEENPEYHEKIEEIKRLHGRVAELRDKAAHLLVEHRGERLTFAALSAGIY